MVNDSFEPVQDGFEATEINRFLVAFDYMRGEVRFSVFCFFVNALVLRVKRLAVQFGL